MLRITFRLSTRPVRYIYVHILFVLTCVRVCVYRFDLWITAGKFILIYVCCTRHWQTIVVVVYGMAKDGKGGRGMFWKGKITSSTMCMYIGTYAPQCTHGRDVYHRRDVAPKTFTWKVREGLFVLFFYQACTHVYSFWPSIIYTPHHCQCVCVCVCVKSPRVTDSQEKCRPSKR
jgi:hypothetical protein